MPSELNIASQIIQQLEVMLPSRLGKTIKEIHPISQFQTRAYSYALCCAVALDNGQDIAIRIKIARNPDTPTLEHAIADEILRQIGRREFTSLMAVYDLIQEDSNSNLCAIQVLGYLSDFNAIIMVELPSRNLKDMLYDLRMRVGIQKFRQRFSNAMVDIGQFLRLYHGRIGQSRLEPFDGELFRKSVTTTINKVSNVLDFLDLTKLQVSFFDVINQTDSQLIHNAALHRDFAFRNIVMTPDNRVAILDMDARLSWQRQPIYLDISRLIVDLVVQKVKILSLGFLVPERYLHQYERLFLGGYFGKEPIDQRFLALYKSLGMLDAMIWYEARVRDMHGIEKGLANLFFPQVQSYLFRKASAFLEEAQN